MIERYTRPKMGAIWSEEAKYRTWLDIEVFACEGWAKVGKIPVEALQAIQSKAAFETEAVLERERTTKHDVAAFVSVVQENIGEAGRYVHYGLTSSDIVDTAFAYRVKTSSEWIEAEIENCLKVIERNAIRDKQVPMVGRTHGIHAEPMSMGMKWLLWYDQLRRAKTRIVAARKEISVGKLSGAVGNYANVPPEVEAHVCERLGLVPDSISTQVISRDRFAGYFGALGLLGSVIEGIAVELRHLQRTELSEVREGFPKDKKVRRPCPTSAIRLARKTSPESPVFFAAW